MASDSDVRYRQFLALLAAEDGRVTEQKDQEYGASWCRRGGQGAYFVAVRKLDRIEEQIGKYHNDVFAALQEDQRAEGLIDDIRDLRRYLLLWEAYAVACGWVPEPTPKTKQVTLQDLVDRQAAIAAAERQSILDAGTATGTVIRGPLLELAKQLELRLRTRKLAPGSAEYEVSHLMAAASAVFNAFQERKVRVARGDSGVEAMTDLLRTRALDTLEHLFWVLDRERLGARTYDEAARQSDDPIDGASDR